MIRDAEGKDFNVISEIYNHYIRHTVITFEESEIDPAQISLRAEKVRSAGLCWIVLEEETRIVGYAYATKWQERSAYRNTVEVSVYVHHEHRGKGYGTKLYTELFSRLKGKNFHVAIGGIALPNPSSEKLHENFGMKKVAHFNEVGFKFGQWIDVGYWQVQLDV